jgi:hypothetical protein
MYPLVREFAVEGIPVAVTCRVLKLARQPYYRWLAQPYYRWLAQPVRSRELAEAHLANALLTPITLTPSSATGCWPPKPETPATELVIGGSGGSARATAGGASSGSGAARLADPNHPLMRTRSDGTSPPPPPTGSGWPTSPSTALARASSTCARSRTCTPTGLSATPSATA